MNITPELLNILMVLARMLAAALANSDHETARELSKITNDTLAGYAATGRIDERTAAFVHENGKFLDERPEGRLTEEEWQASAERTRQGLAAWNAAGPAAG